VKYLLMVIGFLFSISSFANEVVTLNGQRIVLFKPATAKAVSKVFISDAEDSAKIESLKKIFAKEKKYCQLAAQNFADINNTAIEMTQKCNRLITKKSFYEMILNDTPTPTSDYEFLLVLSQFFTLILLF
jgi:hypothetical protein